MTAHALDQLTVWDTAGRQVRLGTLWADQEVVCLFVRHFGCLFCKQHVADMSRHVGRIRSLGAELFVVGNGSIEEARRFRDELPLRFPVLTDPSRQAYDALGMRRGLRTLLRPAVLLAAAALGLGFRQSGVAGDPYQQGGVVVMARGGREVYRFVSRWAGERPKAEVVMAAIERACERSPA